MGARRVVAAFVAGGTWCFLACSSDRPPAIDGEGTTFDASPVVDASRLATRDAASDAAPCLGDELVLVDGGAPGALIVDGGPACASVATACQAGCERIVQRYRAGVALDVVRCLREECAGPADIVPCVDRAVALACPAADRAAFCSPLTSACVDEAGDAAAALATFPQEGCERYASALTADGRATLSACITSVVPAGGCPAGAAGCADRIRQ